MAYTRINWEDLPSTNTPINATNLNKMDKGIKDNYDEIQTKATLEDIQDNLVNVSNSVDEDYRVNVLKGKNLFSFNHSETYVNVASTYDGSTLTLNGTNSTSASNLFQKLKMIYLKAGIYTITTNEVSGTRTGGQSLVLTDIDTNTNIIDTTYTPGSSNTFTLNSDAYICVWFYFRTTSQVFTNYKINIQIEKGSTATSYEPYITPSINVDGEEIYSQDIYNNMFTRKVYSVTLSDNQYVSPYGAYGYVSVSKEEIDNLGDIISVNVSNDAGVPMPCRWDKQSNGSVNIFCVSNSGNKTMSVRVIFCKFKINYLN